MRVLVLGHKGYIGSNLFKLLQQSSNTYDYEVYGIDKQEGPEYDVLTETGVNKIKEIRPDLIYNMAALPGEVACRIDKVQSRRINGYFPSLLHMYVPEAYIIQASTASVLGITEPEEEFPYAHHKNLMEQILWGAPNVLLLRFGTVFGLGYKDATTRWDLLVNVMAKNAVHNGAIKITNPEACRPLVHVRDLANWLTRICYEGKIFKHRKWGVPVPVCSHNLTLQEIANTVSEVTGAPIELIKEEQEWRNYSMPALLVYGTGFKTGVAEMVYELRRQN